jgi:DNA repair exonuclease SbcCD ATPase subunit
MEELQVNEVLTRNRELQNEQNVNLETLARFAMEFQQWAHDQINRLRPELEHKINEVKQLQELACSQAKKIEKMGFEIDSKDVMVKELQRELENKMGVVKELQQLACSQSQMIEQVGFKINNKVVICCEVQHELDNKNGEVKELLQQLENKIREVNLLQRELDNKNDEIKELKQPDDFIVNRLQGAWEGGFVAGRAEERSVHVLAPPICATSQ